MKALTQARTTNSTTEMPNNKVHVTFGKAGAFSLAGVMTDSDLELVAGDDFLTGPSTQCGVNAGIDAATEHARGAVAHDYAKARNMRAAVNRFASPSMSRR